MTDPKPLMILVAGPYRSGTGGDPKKIAANLAAMNDAAYAVYQKGHIPMLGEWLALPLIELASQHMDHDTAEAEIFHPSARRLLTACHACLRIGGPSTGADDMVSTSESLGLTIYYSLDDIPTISTE